MTWFIVASAIVGWLFALILLSVIASVISMTAHKQMEQRANSDLLKEQEIDQMLKKLFRDSGN